MKDLKCRSKIRIYCLDFNQSSKILLDFFDRNSRLFYAGPLHHLEREGVRRKKIATTLITRSDIIAYKDALN